MTEGKEKTKEHWERGPGICRKPGRNHDHVLRYYKSRDSRPLLASLHSVGAFNPGGYNVGSMKHKRSTSLLVHQ